MQKPLLCILLVAVAVFCSACVARMLVPEEEIKYSEARYDEVIAVLEPSFDSNGTLGFISMRRLCESYRKVKSFDRYVSCLDRMDAHGWLGLMSTLDRTRLQIDLGNYREAISTCEPVLDAGKFRRSQGHMDLLGVCGLAYALNGEKNRAHDAVIKMESLPFNMFSDQPSYFQDRDLHEAKIYLALQRYDKALEVMQRVNLVYNTATAIFKAEATAVFGIPNVLLYTEMPTRFMRVKAEYATGHLKEARAGYDALLALEQTRLDGEIYWQLLSDRGHIAEADKDVVTALDYYSKAIDVVEQQRKTIGSDASKIGFVGNKQALYQSVVDLLIRQGQQVKAFEYVERAKSRALVDLLAGRKDISSKGDLADAGAALQQLAELDGRYGLVSVSVRNDKTQLRSAMGEARELLRQTAPELASLVTVSASSAADVQAQLSPDEVLLEYYGSDDNLYAFTVTRNHIKAVKLDGKGLEADVRALREALRDVRFEAWMPLASKLHARLIAPVADDLAKPKLIIVSHGALHYVPWSALTDTKQFLVDKASIQHLPSASVMQFLVARRAATAKDMLLLGNPDLGDKTMDLPSAEAEAKAIKGIWPNSTILMRKAATKAALTRAGQLFKIIHVAAHGEFVSDQPLASRLLLAPDGSDNGQLTAGDLYEMRLSADLVTLSACETGMGKVLSGDDVVGLTRGFLYAGANSIVASLWPVSDDETKFLMTSFYSNLKKMPKVEALRQAQLETKKKYPHPFFWSAFQLTGMGK